MRAPSAGRIAKTLERIGAMSREEFTAALEAGWRAQGYEVSRTKSAQADLELRRAGRLSLVGCRRWKAASTGVEPLRELHAAGQAREAQELIYVAAGGITEQARAFAEANAIRLVQGAELAALVRRG
ncbi:MAG: restriction endonuclease [Betaproteobacteria bacterium]|nr:MAG: restriction endonuclease [Betaproteobacteria bacterium]